MRIDVKDSTGRRWLTVRVDADRPPTVVRADDGSGVVRTLDWERAVDDQGRLRHCPVCGCEHLYVRRAVPTVVGFALVVLAAVLGLVLLGSGLAWLGLVVFGAMVVVEIGLWLWVERQLVCYRCGSVFRGVPGGDQRRRWDAALAAKYPKTSAKPVDVAGDNRASGQTGGVGEVVS
ncbi:MAG: hypothetical protein AAGI68_00985 [Planctomycetota bacterium]